MTDYFQKQLQYGMQGEKVVEAWLGKQGYFVTPTSLIVDPRNRAPSLVRQVSGERVVVPDIQASFCGATRWIEVKTKTQDVFYNKTREYRQGIQERLFSDYLFVERETGIAGYLAFLVLRPAPIKLRIGSLRLLYQHKRTGIMDGSAHCFFPIDIFETHRVDDDDLVLLAPAPQDPGVHYPWEKTAPATNVQQEYFDFGAGEERRRVI